MSQPWDEAKLQSYIANKVEESAALEYKAAGALSRDKRNTDEITKDVAAFANAAGGTLIYGIREFNAKDKQHLPERIDPVDRRDFSREWLEHIIGKIQPRLPVLIHPVPLASAPEHVAYVVEIEAGKTAYQAADMRYYRRHNFESVAMADYEIRDVMRRRSDPVVKTEVRIFVGRHGINNRLRWTLRNESDVFVRYSATRLEIPVFLVPSGNVVRFENTDKMISDDEGFSAWHLRAGSAFSTPLFPRGTLSADYAFRFAELLKTEGDEPLKARDVVRFTTYADHMLPVSGEMKLADILIRETLED
jgi:hypothetical protein